jgi:hypothetical protein
LTNLQKIRRSLQQSSNFNSAFDQYLKQNSEMYRAYACGVGLPQRHDELHWQKFLKDSHHRRMREIKPAIDNKVGCDFNSENLSITSTCIKLK